MALPYTSSRGKKRPEIAIAKSRVVEICVRIPASYGQGLTQWAEAHIRQRAGGYRYLVWRDGQKVREMYLGKVSGRCPTAAAHVKISSPAPANLVRRVRKTEKSTKRGSR